MSDKRGVSQRELSLLASDGEGLGIKISSMCTVFAESEVIGLVGRGEPREGIAYGVLESVASRVVSLAGGFSDEGPYYLTGGLCDNQYFVELVGRLLGTTVSSCPYARFAGALGAAERALAL